MALIQALLTLLGRSAGKLANSVFGWAVVALFGRSSPKEQTVLSGIVAMAVLWPLLLVGVAFPRVAALLVAYVPLSGEISESTVRIIWIALAVAVPLVVGLVVAAKAPKDAEREGFLKRALRGFPLTLGLAGSFALMFATVPALRVISILRGWSDEHIPLITQGDEYQAAAAKIEALIPANGLEASRAEPPWWMKAPAAILHRMGGRALRGFMPKQLAYWKGPALQIALYPSDALVRGAEKKAAWTRGVVEESFARGPGFQTFEPEAQDLETQVQRVWGVYEEKPEAHRGSRFLLGRVEEMVRDLSTLDVPYEQWQVLYRKIAQLARALEGERQLLEAAASAEGGTMNAKRTGEAVPAERPLESASTGELLGQFFRQTSELLKKELELARSELGSSVKSAVTMTVGFAAALVFGMVGVGLLSAAVVLALVDVMHPGTAALLVGVVMLALAGTIAMIAKKKGIKKPLERTQKTLKEDVQWAKERMA